MRELHSNVLYKGANVRGSSKCFVATHPYVIAEIDSNEWLCASYCTR